MKFALKDVSGNYIRVLNLGISLTTDSPQNAKIFLGDSEDYCKGMAAMLSLLHGEKYIAHFIN